MIVLDQGRYDINTVEQEWIGAARDDLSNEQYHHESPGASNSWLWELLKKTPRAALRGKESARHFVIGSAVNDYVLHPAMFDEQYAVAAVKGRRTKAFKLTERKYPNRTVLTTTDWEEVQALGEAILKNPRFERMTDDDSFAAEPSLFGEYEGILVKCRPDMLFNGVVVDLKTAADPSPGSFAWSVANYGYHQSVALTCRIVAQHTGQRPRYLFCVVGKDDPAPENVAWYELDREYEEVGELKLKQAVRKLKESFTKRWLGYPDQVMSIGPPWRDRG